MRDKEKLLSFETPLKFIFSHSALREGWDNPNVFQICALREMGTDRERRQTLGRGLRLCVNQDGERLRGFEVNTLTVIAREDYQQFAENLQREIEQDTGIRFGVVEKHAFASIPQLDATGKTEALGLEQSEAIWAYLNSAGYVDTQGRVQERLREALRERTLELPVVSEASAPRVTAILRKLAGRLDIKNADERISIKPRQAVLDSAEFKALWDRIKHRTTYRVRFDNVKLVEDCARALRDAPSVGRTTLQWRKADIAIGKGGVTATGTTVASVPLDDASIELPDLLTELQDRTQLTRRSIHRILSDSGRLADFARNPQQFIDLAAEAINRSKRLAIVDGIKYQRLGDDYYYAQELFAQEELTGYLKNTLEATRCVYERVVFDPRGVEGDFARELEDNKEAVKVYAKLPGWFKVPTPLGTYNPDWAVVLDMDGEERFYFVVETKGSLFTDDLRPVENAKLRCGREHFRALAVAPNPARFVQARTLEDVIAASDSQP